MKATTDSCLVVPALRYKGICIDVDPASLEGPSEMTPATAVLLERLIKCGYICEEPLVKALNQLSDLDIDVIAMEIQTVLGLTLNWAPLVKGWLNPTGETRLDHLVTFIANIFPATFPGVTLECGHFIPEGTFPLDRYNGCPFCGRPFRTAPGEHFHSQGSRLKSLRLIFPDEMRRIYTDLLESGTPLDETSIDSVLWLMKAFGIPEGVEIKMKETAAIMADELIKEEDLDGLCRLLATPSDLLRYLWMKHTSQKRLIRPATLISLTVRDKFDISAYRYLDDDTIRRQQRRLLHLHYSRQECRMWATVLNRTGVSAARACEMMNPQRGMWVRMIRALRLTEFARRKGFEKLREILDRFYRRDYTVWQAEVNDAVGVRDSDRALSLLRRRPGLFARQLFPAMLKLGMNKAIKAFEEVSADVPMRLLLTLSTYAESYFNDDYRMARPITGRAIEITCNPGVKKLNEGRREMAVKMVNTLIYAKIREVFAKKPAPGATVYIEPQLFNVPVAIGDRSTTVQDTGTAVQGMRFPLEGSKVRLFMQWGRDLPAQLLDMDLSAIVIFDHFQEAVCYYNLNVDGGQHSGDIRHIPDIVGTAEYIELDVDRLAEREARMVAFTCNAYSSGTLSPNLVVGWMDSANPMKVSDETGVAYDPSTVIFQTRIPDDNISKGLLFGLLDVAERQIIWLEMPFDGQLGRDLDISIVNTLLRRLKAKPSIGQCLTVMAEARGMTITDDPATATETYIDPFLSSARLLKSN